jgi:putative hemolysin
VDDPAVTLAALAVLLVFSGFFSGSEAAFFSLTRAQLKSLSTGSTAGRLVSRLRHAPRKLLVSILLGNLFVNIFSTSAATSLSIRLYGERGIGLAFVLMSFLIISFGEIIPKAIALNRPRKFSLLFAYPLQFFHAVFLPIRAPLTLVSEAVIGFLKGRLGPAKMYFTREELLTALRIGRFEGDVGKFEHELLSNILSFRSKIIKEIMTPSVSVFSVPARSPVETVFNRMVKGGYSRVPVHEGSTDNIIGVVHIKDVLRAKIGDASLLLRELIKPVYHVPETAPIADLFTEMIGRKTHLAVVIDEYGSFVGIVTVEDVLEELVGEIRDSNEPRTETYRLVGDNRIVVLGTMGIDDFNEVFKTNLVDEEHETIAGYVLGATGKIPKEGETIAIGDLNFFIISAMPNVIRKMRVEKR